MTSVTASSSSMNMDMISRLMLAGQVKLVGATSKQYASSSTQTVASISIPALTGSQIAIVYLEISAENTGVSSPTVGSCNMTATGTGVNVGVSIAPLTINSDDLYATSPAASQYFRNSAFGTTTTGSQTVTFSSISLSGYTYVTAQASIFIYTPPF